MEGLEVRAVDNSWIKATPRSGTVLINVGDLLEIYSNGLFPATLHRVVIPGLLQIFPIQSNLVLINFLLSAKLFIIAKLFNI